MSRNRLGMLILLTFAVDAALAAPSEVSSFDCSKVQADVEKLVCGDAALASLDRKLAEVYRSAQAKSRGPLMRQLREEQRGWVKGRNDCWKANGQETWITATWTVNTVRGCVDAQYRMRIAELQAVWRLQPAKTSAYACQGDAANEVIANFFDTDPATLRLERGDRSMTLWRVGDVAAGRYEGQNISVMRRNGELSVSGMDASTGGSDGVLCKAK
jgi:uncharacterized protein